MRTKSAFFTQVFAFTRSGEKILRFGILYLFFAGWVPPSSAAEPGRVTTLMTKALEAFPGKEATMITVDYAPGGADPVHRHNAIRVWVRARRNRIGGLIAAREHKRLKPIFSLI